MNHLVINVMRLKDGEPESVNCVVNPKELDIEYVDLQYTTDITLEGAAEKILNTLTFHGTLSRRIALTCARCLKIVEETVEEPINLSCEIQGVQTIDLTNDVRDALIFSRPDHFLCDPNCKGLCPNCGVNLNAESCQCKNHSTSVSS